MVESLASDEVAPQQSRSHDLLWDESGIEELSPGAVLLVIDAHEVAIRAAERGLEVWAFSDRAAHAVVDAEQATQRPMNKEQVHSCVPGDAIPTPELTVMSLPHHLKALGEYTAWAHELGCPRIAGVGRERHLNRSMNETLGRWYHQVSASRGRAKSRVLKARIPQDQVHAQPWPRVRREPTTGLQVASHGGTFAGGRLDRGTAMVVSAWPQVVGTWSTRPTTAVDWGSGSGILAALLARDLPDAQVHAVDVSWAGAAATDATAAANGLMVHTHWVNGIGWLASRPDSSIDLLVTNPAFHQGVAKESGDTQAMLRQLGRVMAPGGQVWCVYNSHLPWRSEFMRMPGRTDVVGQDRSYTLVRWTAD